MSDAIHLSRADITDLEEEYILSSIRSGWVAPAGPDLTAFEEEVAARVGVDHAVALSSGTAALHLTLVSWGVGPGHTIPVSSFTFAATVNAIRYVGAEPHFIDCDSSTGNISPHLLREALHDLRKRGKSVPAIIPVDMLGKVADYTAITEIVRESDVRLLCDAAESFGARRLGRPAGSFGDASVVSFNGNKIMTTSGGGMLLTNESNLAAHIRKLSTQAREPVLHYEHTEVGYNYRLSNLLAALGRAQLTRLDEMIGRRRTWRRRYRTLVANYPGITVLGGDDDVEDNCWLTAIVLDPDLATTTAAEVGSALRQSHIETRPLWKPMHLQPVFQSFGGTIDGSSEYLFENALALPSGSSLTEDQFSQVEEMLHTVIGHSG